MAELPSFIDPELWFTTAHGGPNKRYYLLAQNPHTFFGRMSGYDLEEKIGFCVSRYEIVSCSKEASYFVLGYLAGNEPPPPTDSEGHMLSPEHTLEVQWQNAIKLFHVTGSWGGGRVCQTCGKQMLPSCLPGFVCNECTAP